MKKVIILISFLVACGISASAQVRIVNSVNNSAVANSPAFIDASSNFTANQSTNIGKGLVFPRVDLSLMTSFPTVQVGTNTAFPNRLDGMIVYNTKVGGVAGVGSTEGELTRGFWYYDNPNGHLASPGVNGGTWRPINSGKDAGWEVVGGNTVTTNHVQINNITRNVGIPAGSQIVIVDENGVMSTIDIGALCDLCNPICPLPATPGTMTITPSTTINVGEQFTATVPFVPNVTYIWVLPNGLSGSSNTNSITVTGVAAGTYPAGSISVVAYNECGGSGVRISTDEITVTGCDLPATPGIMVINPTTVNVNGTFTATVPHVSGVVYLWTLPSGLSGISITNSITITGVTPGTYPIGSISVKATNPCGESAAASFSTVEVTVQSATALPCGSSVNIGGSVWACSNVDATGTFAATVSNRGRLFQWNRSTAWPYPVVTGPTAGWPTTANTAASWAPANDPCPAGWRVPTESQFSALIAVPHVWISAAQASSLGLSPANAGFIFGSASVPATFNPAVHLYLPVTGRIQQSGQVNSLTLWDETLYWTASRPTMTNHRYVHNYNTALQIGSADATNGFGVRCVQQ